MGSTTQATYCYYSQGKSGDIARRIEGSQLEIGNQTKNINLYYPSGSPAGLFNNNLFNLTNGYSSVGLNMDYARDTSVDPQTGITAPQISTTATMVYVKGTVKLPGTINTGDNYQIGLSDGTNSLGFQIQQNGVSLLKKNGSPPEIPFSGSSFVFELTYHDDGTDATGTTLATGATLKISSSDGKDCYGVASLDSADVSNLNLNIPYIYFFGNGSNTSIGCNDPEFPGCSVWLGSVVEIPFLTVKYQ